jgi:hypothetical protein
MRKNQTTTGQNGTDKPHSGIHSLATFDGDAVNVVIQTSKGGRAKMKYVRLFINQAWHVASRAEESGPLVAPTRILVRSIHSLSKIAGWKEAKGSHLAAQNLIA